MINAKDIINVCLSSNLLHCVINTGSIMLQVDTLTKLAVDRLNVAHSIVSNPSPFLIVDW